MVMEKIADYLRQIRVEVGAYIINRHVKEGCPIDYLLTHKEELTNSLQSTMGSVRRLMNMLGRVYLELEFNEMSEYRDDSDGFRRILKFFMDEVEQPENSAV
jgi:hypothetical protein